MGEVGDRRLQAGPVGGELLGQQVQEGAGPHGILPCGEGVQIGYRPVGEAGIELLQGADKAGALPGQNAVLQQSVHVFSHLPEIVFPPLGHPGTFAEEHHRISGQIVGGGGHLRIDQGQVPVQGREGGLLGQPLQILLQILKEGGLVPLPAADLGEQPGQALLQSLCSAGGELGQHLGRREEGRLLTVFRAALGVDVKIAHGVRLVAEELHPDRTLLARGEKVQDAAPQGKLTHALHLLPPGIARGREGLRQLVQVIALPQPDRAAGPFQGLRRQGALEERLHRHHSEGAPPLQQGLEGGQTPVLILAGDHRGMVEGELPGRHQAHLLPGQDPQVPAEALPLGLIGAEQHHAPAGLPPDRGGDIGPQHRGEAGEGRGASPLLHSRQELAHLRQLPQDLGQQLHAVPSFPKNKEVIDVPKAPVPIREGGVRVDSIAPRRGGRQGT